MVDSLRKQSLLIASVITLDLMTLSHSHHLKNFSPLTTSHKLPMSALRSVTAVSLRECNADPLYTMSLAWDNESVV